MQEELLKGFLYKKHDDIYLIKTWDLVPWLFCLDKVRNQWRPINSLDKSDVWIGYQLRIKDEEEKKKYINIEINECG